MNQDSNKNTGVISPTLNNETPVTNPEIQEIDNYTPVINPAPIQPAPQPATVQPEANKQQTQVMAAPVNAKIKKPDIKRSEKAKQIVNASKNKQKLIIIIFIIGIIAFFGFKVISSMGGLKNMVDKALGENKEFKIDTGKDWADLYGTYIKDYYEDLGINKFDIAFIDFNDDNTPEMSLRYEPKEGQFATKIFQINNKEITESKFFYNAQYKLVYSSLSEKINWYLYIASNNKYGTYTEISKILNGTVKNPDIKASNESELTQYNKTYLASEYRINYYECKKDKYLDNFQTAVDKYEEYNSEAKKAKSKLQDDTANWRQEQETGPVKTSIKVGEHTLQFGSYKAEVTIKELGKDKNVIKEIILRDGILTYDGEDIAYTAYTAFISVADGKTFEVIGDNEFNFNNEGPYELEE